MRNESDEDEDGRPSQPFHSLSLSLSLSLSSPLLFVCVFSAVVFVVARLCHPRWFFFSPFSHPQTNFRFALLVDLKEDLCMREKCTTLVREINSKCSLGDTDLELFLPILGAASLELGTQHCLAGPLFKKVAFGLAAFNLHGAVVNVAAKNKLKSAIFSALNPIFEFLLVVYIFFNLLGASFFGTPFLGYLPLAVSEMATVALGVFFRFDSM